MGSKGSSWMQKIGWRGYKRGGEFQNAEQNLYWSIWEYHTPGGGGGGGGTPNIKHRTIISPRRCDCRIYYRPGACGSGFDHFIRTITTSVCVIAVIICTIFKLQHNRYQSTLRDLRTFYFKYSICVFANIRYVECLTALVNAKIY